jgi:beta-glucosidase/6-phospho-beta-glucosidase/beta-galactosidase
MLKFNALLPLMTEKVVPASTFQDDAGQVVYPGGLPAVLLSLKRYPVPMMVMAGIADSQGTKRADFLKQMVQQVRAARLQGCELNGFIYDSFLSGFEFDRGFTVKKGLISVNTRIQEREAAPGAETFAAFAKSNGADDAPIKLRKPRARKTDPQ